MQQHRPEALTAQLPSQEILAFQQSLEYLGKLPREKLEEALKHPKVQAFLNKMSASMRENPDLQHNTSNAEQVLSADLQNVSETLNTSLEDKALSLLKSVGNFTVEQVKKHPLPMVALFTLLGYGISHPSQAMQVINFLTWVATHPIEAAVAGAGGVATISAGIKGAIHFIVPGVKAAGSSLFEAASSFVSKQAATTGAEVVTKVAPFVLPEMGLAGGGELASNTAAAGAKAIAGEATSLGMKSIATEAAMVGLRGLGTIAGAVASLPFTALTVFFGSTGELNAGEEEALARIYAGTDHPIYGKK